MEDKRKDLAIEIVAENMNDLLNKYTEIEEGIESEKLQEKLEVLAEVKNQISIGNDKIINKVIEKRNMGIL